MLTKLTLTIDDKVVERAKLYATRRHRSVSRMVEEYLRAISDDSTVIANTKIAPITNSLVGMFSDVYKGEEYSEILDQALSERHL